MIPGNRNIGEKRIEKLKKIMEDKNVDGVIVVSNHNVYYISGFLASTPAECWTWLNATIVPVDGEPALLLPSMEKQHAEEDSWIRDLRYYRSERYYEEATELIKEKGVAKRIGIETEMFPVQWYDCFKKLLSAEFINFSPVFEEMRRIKSVEELRVIEISAEVANIGAEKAIDTVREGVPELVVQGEAERAMKIYLSERYPEVKVPDYPNTPSFCRSGPRSYYPIIEGSSRRIGSSETVICMNYSLCDGYWAEIERTVLVSGSPEQRKIYEAMVECRLAAIEEIRPSITWSELDAISKKVIEKAGYTKHFLNYGHSIGISAHERPELCEGGMQEKLLPNMVFTYEPGIYHPKLGGFRHSDTFIMTDKGARRLTSCSWELYR